MLALFPLLATTALASFIPTTPQDAIHLAEQLLHPTASSGDVDLLEVHPNHFDAKSGKHRKLCVLHPRGEGQWDDDNFLKAHDECGQGGIIRLPDANYTIGNPITTHLNDAVLDVHGWISFTADIDHWIEKRVPFEFQNLALAWIIIGDNYVLDGNDKGGIYGNGDVWYSWAKEEGNKYGRPMSFAITNSSNVLVKNWSVVQPQFWASIVINSTDVTYRDYYVNATIYDPEAMDKRLNWLQNTDGCDTYRSHNVTFENMVYQGGDDCLALKPNSSLITIRNVTCHGGTGMAFGSIGQYAGVVDYIKDVSIDGIRFLPGQHNPEHGLYYKSWLGYEVGTPPNGGGGGTGYARNITVKDVVFEKVLRPVYLQSDLIYLLDRQGEGRNTGLFHWSDIHMSNLSGTSLADRVVFLDCSERTPCANITFDGIDVKPGKSDRPELNYVCNNVIMNEKSGLDSCHPNGSLDEGSFAP